MATIIDYVAQETRDFSEYPFHVADALVYAWVPGMACATVRRANG